MLILVLVSRQTEDPSAMALGEGGPTSLGWHDEKPVVVGLTVTASLIVFVECPLNSRD